MTDILKISNLKVIFQLDHRVVNAVENASLRVKENETVVLAGESGSGKTITALSITKILPPNAQIISGSVKFFDRELLAMDENGLTEFRGAMISYVFQEPAAYLNPVFSVGAQIQEAIMLHQRKSKKEARMETIRLLELVKISDPQRVFVNYPHQLSGGMNQRIFIAMSLACRPKLLIADEPTTSLDVTIEKEVLELLIELKKTMGFSLLLITHNLGIAKRIADRIYIMYRGCKVEEGDSRKIFDSPEHAHTKELIAAYKRIGTI